MEILHVSLLLASTCVKLVIISRNTEIHEQQILDEAVDDVDELADILADLPDDSDSDESIYLDSEPDADHSDEEIREHCERIRQAEYRQHP